MRILIADDEPLALQRLKQALATYSDIEVVATARDGREVVERIRQFAPDVALLDIAMPELNGIEAVASLDPERVPAIIFVTAHDHFALEAIREGAVDYVLKPVDPERLARSLDRARRAIASRSAEERIEELRRALAAMSDQTKTGPSYEKALWVPTRHEIVRVPLAEVVWFGVDGDYVEIHALGGDYLVHDSLRSLEERLDPSMFIRVHRQAIVRIDAVAAVERRPMGKVRLQLQDGSSVNLGRKYKAALDRILAGR